VSGKVFGVGLSRTGTLSLNEALKHLGYSSLHFPGSLADISKYDAATDTPVAAYFEQLDAQYPGSKFILTVRDELSWLASVKWLLEEAHCFQKTPDQTKWHPMIGIVHDILYHTRVFDAGKLSQARTRHTARVLSYFRGRPLDLLVMDVTRGDGWERLCPFLKREIPARPFPRFHERPKR
jgi:hypothetical protein